MLLGAFILSCMITQIQMTGDDWKILQTMKRYEDVEIVEPMDAGTAVEGEADTIQNADPDDENTSSADSMDAGAESTPVEKTLYGVCTISHYCNCSQCCGKWAGGGTASGTTPTAGRTVAADLPFGTRLLINGHEYIVEDRGVSGMWIDIYCDSHEEALQRGLYQTEVYIVG